MTSAYDYIHDHGLTTDKKYPYKARNMKCKTIPDKDKFHVSKYEALKGGCTQELSEALTKVPVSIALEV